jgi:hypothetical protein
MHIRQSHLLVAPIRTTVDGKYGIAVCSRETQSARTCAAVLQAITTAAALCRQDLSVATSQIGDLFARVKDIQAKAADSEVLVQEICRDIRKVCGCISSRQQHCCRDCSAVFRPCAVCSACRTVLFQLAGDARDVRTLQMTVRAAVLVGQAGDTDSCHQSPSNCCVICQSPLHSLAKGAVARTHMPSNCGACCCCLLQLDYAKRHLTHTITSLRRLAMLTAAVDDLEQVSTAALLAYQGLGAQQQDCASAICLVGAVDSAAGRLCTPAG